MTDLLLTLKGFCSARLPSLFGGRASPAFFAARLPSLFHGFRHLRATLALAPGGLAFAPGYHLGQVLGPVCPFGGIGPGGPQPLLPHGFPEGLRAFLARGFRNNLGNCLSGMGAACLAFAHQHLGNRMRRVARLAAGLPIVAYLCCAFRGDPCNLRLKGLLQGLKALKGSNLPLSSLKNLRALMGMLSHPFADVFSAANIALAGGMVADLVDMEAHGHPIHQMPTMGNRGMG